ncbi:MAG: hypothetical protein ABUK01_15805 [Leptospirales bacterium]
MRLKLLYIIFISLAVSPLLYAETVYWEGRNDEKGFAVDIPPEWDKDYEIGTNGVVFQARNKNALIEVRSFYLEETKTMEELVNLKSARLFGKYSYIFMLRESEEPDGKHIVLWKLKYRGVSFLEKTAIVRDGEHVLILSCLSTLDEYEENRYIFENATVSVKFTENGIPQDKIQEIYKIEKDKKELVEIEGDGEDGEGDGLKNVDENEDQKEPELDENSISSPVRDVDADRIKPLRSHDRKSTKVPDETK